MPYDFDRDAQAREHWERWVKLWRTALERGREIFGYVEHNSYGAADEALAVGWRALLEEGMSAEVLRMALSGRPSAYGLELDEDDEGIAAAVDDDSGYRRRGELGTLAARGTPELHALVAELFPDEVLSDVHRALAAAEGSAAKKILGALHLDSERDLRGIVWPEPLRPVIAYLDPPSRDAADTHGPERIEQLLHALSRTRDALVRRSLASELRQAVEADLDEFLPTVAFHLGLGDADRDDFILGLAMDHIEVRDELRRLGADSAAPVFRRADGMLHAIEHGDLATLTSTYLWWVDQDLYSAPNPLPAPSAIWLGDGRIEEELRLRFDGAVRRLPEAGISEETELTGALIGNLIAAAGPDLPSSAGIAPPVRMDITSTNATTHEPLSGADIGIVLRIERPGHEVVETGHLVQVKQSQTRDDPAAAPQWLITRDQIDLMLADDPTATYWLLTPRSPKLLVVPAKTLLARFERGRGAHTVQYEEVRSAAVPLGSALVDLLLGLWIGSPSVLGVAKGQDSRHVPANILEIRLRAGE